MISQFRFVIEMKSTQHLEAFGKQITSSFSTHSHGSFINHQQMTKLTVLSCFFPPSSQQLKTICFKASTKWNYPPLPLRWLIQRHSAESQAYRFWLCIFLWDSVNRVMPTACLKEERGGGLYLLPCSWVLHGIHVVSVVGLSTPLLVTTRRVRASNGLQCCSWFQ